MYADLLSIEHSLCNKTSYNSVKTPHDTVAMHLVLRNNTGTSLLFITIWWLLHGVALTIILRDLKHWSSLLMKNRENNLGII